MLSFKYVKLRKKSYNKDFRSRFSVSAQTDKITASVSFKAFRVEG